MACLCSAERRLPSGPAGTPPHHCHGAGPVCCVHASVCSWVCACSQVDAPGKCECVHVCARMHARVRAHVHTFPDPFRSSPGALALRPTPPPPPQIAGSGPVGTSSSTLYSLCEARRGSGSLDGVRESSPDPPRRSVLTSATPSTEPTRGPPPRARGPLNASQLHQSRRASGRLRARPPPSQDSLDLGNKAGEGSPGASPFPVGPQPRPLHYRKPQWC